MPPAGLTSAPRGAPLACVKWLFTRTVHFILHRLEALRGAEITNGYMFKSHPNHLSPGRGISGGKKAKEGSNWVTQCSSVGFFGLLFSLVSHWMENKLLVYVVPSVWVWFLLSLELLLPPHPVPFSFEELLAGSVSCLHLEDWVVSPHVYLPERWLGRCHQQRS